MDYEIEELLPIVSELAQRYSGYENTSITYEKAQTLMRAVVYCLEEYRNAQTASLVSKSISITEQYDIGLKLVFEKAQNIRKLFNELSFYFEDYGVKCLRDTVQKGIPEFLKWYDVKFSPQDTILTLDYPLLVDYNSLSGADKIYQYLCGIQIEQRFLKMFDKNYVVSVLKKYTPQYEYMVENVCNILLANTIGHVVINKSFHEIGFQNEEYLQLAEIFRTKSASDIKRMIKHTMKEIVERFFDNDTDMIEYLYHDAGNIAVSIETASRNQQLNKLFII